MRSPGWAVASAAAVLLASMVFPMPEALAQSDLTWINGSSNWDLSTPAWNGGAGATVWTQGANAVFAGTGETVAVGAEIALNNLTFAGNGFVIPDSGAAGSIALAGPSTVGVTTSGHTATLGENVISGALAKIGAGTLVLAGTNSFEGAVAVSAGRLTAASNWALGSTAGGTTVADAAQLTLADGVTITGESLAIAGSGINFSGALNAAANATAAWAGPVAITSGGRVGTESGGRLTLSGVVSGGPFILSAYGSGASVGTVVLSNTGNTYSGETQIYRGRLLLGATNALPVGTTLNVDAANTPSEPSIFDLGGFNQTVAGLTRSANSEGGSFIRNSGAGPSTLTVNQAGNTSYSGILEDGGGLLHLTKTGAGTLTLSGNNTHAGTTTASGGTLNLAGASSAAGQFVVNTGATLLVSHNQGLGSTAAGTLVNSGGRLMLGNGVTVTGETVTINGNGFDNNGALRSADGATATWAGGIVLAGSMPRIGGGVGGTLHVNGVISGATGILFSRGNDATTVLNAVSTYTGDTQMFANGGTRAVLRMGVDNAISPFSQYSTIAAAATKPMELDLNGHALTMRALDTSANHANGANAFILNHGATPSTFTVSGASGSTIFTGIFADGTGGLSLVKDGASTQILAGASTYTGSTTVRAGVLQVGASVGLYGANGRLASTEYHLTGGTLALDNLGTNNLSGNRLPDASVLRFQGGNLLFKGSDQAATNSTETVGTLDFDRGISSVVLRFGGTNTAAFTAGQLVRSSGGGLGFVNGANLGKDATATSSVARMLVPAAPTLVGTTDATASGINAAVRNTKIVPFLLGSAAAGSGGLGTEGSTPNTFVTYQPGTGLRPLNPVDEFSSTVTAGDNVRLTANGVVAASTNINSLIIEGAVTLKINFGQTLQVASGAILFSAGNEPRLDGPGVLDFGTQEGLVTINSTSVTYLTPVIAGSAGVTYHGSGTLVLGGQQNTYSGDTVLRVANVIPQASSTGPAGAPVSGPFGTGTVILDGSTIRSTTSNPVTVANPVILRADTVIPAAANSKNLSFTGPVTLENGTRTLTQHSAADTIFAGTISGASPDSGVTIAGSGSGSVVFEGLNTYTGPTTVTGATLSISSEANLGANPATANPAQLQLNGGTLRSTASFALDDVNRGVTVGPSGGTLETVAGTTLTLENGLALAGDLAKTGEGTLLVNGAGSGAGGITVSAGTLGGRGTLAGNATIAAGANITGGTVGGLETLGIGGNLTSSPGSAWLIDLVQGSGGGTADTIEVAGALDLGNASLSINYGGSFAAYEKFVIARYGTLSSTFAGLANDAIFEGGGGFYQINYFDSGAVTLTAIPEPEVWVPALLVLGLGFAGAGRSRRGRPAAGAPGAAQASQLVR